MDGIFGMGFIWIIWVIVIAAVVWFVYQFKSNNPNHFNTSVETPLDIIKRRYANGEISKEEFDNMKKDLV